MTVEITTPGAERTDAEPVGGSDRAGLIRAMARGFLGRCPHCGSPRRVFGRFLKVQPACGACGLELRHHRADDLPPYVVIFVVAHLVGYLILETESAYDVPLWVEIGVWPAFTLLLALALLQPVKGAVVGLQYALGMHGFAALPRGRPGRVTREPGTEETRIAPAAAGDLDRA